MQITYPYLLLTLLPALASAAPTTTTLKPRQEKPPYLRETEPWKLTDISVFEPVPGHQEAAAESRVSFHFVDVNPGLEVDSICQYNVTAGSDITDASRWHECEDPDVRLRFQYTGDRIEIAKTWVDPNVGPPGMDVVTGFGRWNTSLHLFNVYASDNKTLIATRKIQGCMEIYNTELIA
ncbi:hypothetical protein K402DRAFT_390120 [Aulographum hederae CBS 113979]|uniref:AA1-like domain-containing protein n=1 Tax=Aulographum hederae CBS 113979 TaxID=1176131 RepID=A0A6G1HBU5_9PEZI|nr:hypothetical protein K402DRAFT_390120 [Aulographum hederae CBS 113979]